VLYITAARLVWAFTFGPPTAVDAPSTSVEVRKPDASMETGYTNCRPLPFSCVILPRSSSVREVYVREEKEALEALQIFEDYYD
jgi:hypothetical protein